MLKRIISLVLSVVVSSFVYTGIVFAKTSHDDTYYVDILSAIGVADENFPQNDSIVSRAELAYYTSKLYGEKYIETAYTGRYTDVSEDAFYVSSVEFLSDMGIMSGYGNGIFMPGRPTEITEVVKVITDILGFRYLGNANGGYPDGYLFAAKTIKLLDGIENLSGVADGRTFAKLLYNALEIDIARVDGMTETTGGLEETYVTYKGVNILSENFKMYIEKGVMEATPLYSLKGHYSNEDTVVVNGNVYDCINYSYADYFGYNIEFVYQYDEVTNRRTLVFASPYNNEVTYLTGNKPVTLSGMNLVYQNDKQKDITKKISPEADVIFNFEKVGLKAEYFSKPYCKIAMIDNNIDGNVDVVVIEELKAITAGTIVSTKTVFDKKDTTASISLDKELYDCMVLVDEKRNKTSFENIRTGSSIVYVTNGKMLKAYICENSFSGLVEREFTENNEKNYVIDSEIYPSPLLVNETTSHVGKMVEVYIDVFGNIIEIIEDKSGGMKIGFLLAAGKTGSKLEDEYSFKIYTSSGEEKTFKSAENVEVNGNFVKKLNLPSTFDKDVIMYSLNDAGEIKCIECQVPTDNSYADGRLRKSFENTNAYAYMSNRTFDAKCVIDGNTTFFSVSTIDHDNDPATAQIYDVSSVQTISSRYFEDRQYYNIKAYTSSKEATSAVAVVNIGAYNASVKTDYNMYAVEKVMLVYDEDGEKYEISGYERGTYKKMTVKSDYEQDFLKLNISEGDVIRCSLNTLDEITFAEMIYDVSEPISSTNPKEIYRDEFYAPPRIYYGEVMAKADDGMVYYLLCSDESKDSVAGYTGYLSDCLAFPATRYQKISVLEINNGRIKVRSGTIDDIEKGDKFIDYTSQQAPYGFVLIKRR